MARACADLAVPIHRLHRSRARKAHPHLHPRGWLSTYRDAGVRLQGQGSRIVYVQHGREHLRVRSCQFQDGAEQEDAFVHVYQEVSCSLLLLGSCRRAGAGPDIPLAPS